MKNIYKLLIYICLIFVNGEVQSADYWQQFVHYSMNIHLDPEEHEIQGESRILYINKSPHKLDRIYLHLYPNAFKEGSVKHREFLQQYGLLSRAAKFIKGKESLLNEFDIQNFSVTQGDTNSTLYQVDDTILMALLPRGANPGDTVTIEIQWRHKVGEQFERAGYVKKQFNMAQWYPKLVVYDEQGWHPNPFHAEGEFYGEFGTFDVTLDLPQSYIVGATGSVVSGDPGWASVEVDTSQEFSEWLKAFREEKAEPDSTARRVVSFHAENVHDFAWIASPTYLYEHGTWNGIDVHVLFNEDRGEKWTRVVRERAEKSLEWLSTKFGNYPYPQVTVTDRIKGGGMEYPMLVMNGSEREGLIVHEIGHIWFYGILANNEMDEAWLDEGFTSFQTRWYLESTYPYGIDFEGYKQYKQKYWKFTSSTSRSQWSAIRFMTSGHDEPVSRSSYLYSNGSAYRMNAYTKPSLMISELKYVLGDSLFLAGMQTYYDRWKLKHVNEQRFVETMEEVTGQELDWFFDSWLHATQVEDYGIRSWSKTRQEDDSWLVTVDIVNHGERCLPLDLEIRTKDGIRHPFRWENYMWQYEDEFQASVPGEPVQVILDPQVQTLDADYRNNVTGILPHETVFRWPGMNYRPRDRYAVRWSPLLYYQNEDGWTPGIWLSRNYGLWEEMNLKLNYALESSRVYWHFQGWRKPVHRSPDLNMEVTAYDQGGVSGGDIKIRRRWNRKYRIPPYHQASVGVYFSNGKDTLRTDLYDTGITTVLYGTYGMNIMGNTVGFEIASAPKGWSDWSFSRLATTVTMEMKPGKVGIRDRFLAGFMWTDDKGVPAQERYTIEGAGSGDMYSKPYLRDASSFYGLEDIRTRYHLPGDANLRGYYNHGYAGVEKAITNSMEVFYKPALPWLNLEIAGFVDGGLFWGSKVELNDNGFNGDLLADAGIGLRLDKTVLGKKLYLRIDFPVWLSTPVEGGEPIDFNRWTVSFQKGL